MPVDIATIGALGGLILPVYVGLWSLNGKVGDIAARTEHNEQAVDSITEAVDSLSERATRIDARAEANESFSGSEA